MNVRRMFLLALLLLTVIIRFRVAVESFLSPAPVYLDHYGIDARVEGENLEVKGSQTAGGPAKTPGARAGIVNGDKILAIGKTPTTMQSIHCFNDYVDAMKTAAPGGRFWLKIARGSKTFDVPLSYVWDDIRCFDLYDWFIIFFGLILMPLLAAGTGFFIGFSKTDDPNAFTACLMFIGFSTLAEGQMAIFLLPSGLREVGMVYFHLLNGLMPYFYMRFFLRFPSPSRIEEKWPWIKHVMFWGFAPLLLVGFIHSLLLCHSFPAAHWLERLWKPFQWYGLVWVSLIFSIGSTSLGMNTGRSRNRDERRRMAILLWGTMSAMIPLLGVVVYQNAIGGRIPAWVIVILFVLLMMFPLSFVYAILKHRVMGLRLIIRRGLQYLLVSRGFLFIEGIVLFLFFFWLADSAFNQYVSRVGQGYAAGATAVLALAAATGLKSVNRRVMPIIDRRFFREAYNARRILSDLGQAVRRLSNRTDQLLQLVTDRISDSLQPDHVAIFLRPTDLPALPAPREKVCFEPEAAVGNGALTGRFCCFRHRLRTGNRDSQIYSHIRFESLCLEGGSVSLHRLCDNSREEPAALEVYLDDPRSWTREIVERSVAEPAVAAEKETLETLHARLLVPLFSGDQPAGFFVLGERLSEEPYSPEDVELLLMVAQQTSIALDYSRLIRQEAEQVKMQREMEIAKEVQGCLFPQTQPVLRTLTYAGLCRAARGVGGDYYDFVSLDSTTLGIALGDVSGKGISAALLMANLQATLRSHATLHREHTDRVMADVNRLLGQATGCGKYATFFYAVYDDEQRTLTYTNAGHNPPVLFRAGPAKALSTARPEDAPPLPAPVSLQLEKAEHLEAGGIPVGLFPEWDYQLSSVSLTPGDVLVIFTDGVSEAMNVAGEEFGEERLISAVTANLHLPAASIAQAVLETVNTFAEGAEQHDDITLVVAKAV